MLADFGIWEFGRFASRYRRLLSELPSQNSVRDASAILKNGIRDGHVRFGSTADVGMAKSIVCFVQQSGRIMGRQLTSVEANSVRLGARCAQESGRG